VDLVARGALEGEHLAVIEAETTCDIKRREGLLSAVWHIACAATSRRTIFMTADQSTISRDGFESVRGACVKACSPPPRGDRAEKVTGANSGSTGRPLVDLDQAAGGRCRMRPTVLATCTE
jgi:hypothetical protein